MAEIKITSLAAISDPASTDVLPIVDVSADITNKISIADLLKNAATGSASAPSFAFDGDSNTGMYRSGADALAFSTGGTGRLFINSSGNIGVGTAAPGAKLHVSGDGVFDDGTNARLTLKGTTSAGQLFSTTTGFAAYEDLEMRAAQYLFKSNGTSELMRIDSSGNVGIGTTSPSYRLDVKSPGNGQFFINGQNSSGTDIFQVYESSTGDGQNGMLYIYDGAGNNDVKLSTNGDSWFNGGSVGIGTTAPEGAGLDVNSSRTTNYNSLTDQRNLAHIIARNASDGTSRFSSISLVNGGSTQTEASINLIQAGNYIGNLAFKMRTGSSSWAERMRIDSSGNVGIGTTSPSQTLHSKSSTEAAMLLQRSGASSDAFGSALFFGNDYSDNGTYIFGIGDGTMRFGTISDITASNPVSSGSERMRIDSSGRLLVGVTAQPTYGANIATFEAANVPFNSFGNVGIMSSSTLAADAGGSLTLGGNYSGSILYPFGSIAGRKSNGTSGNAEGYLQFCTTNSGNSIVERMRIDSSGNVGIGTSSPARRLEVRASASGELVCAKFSNAQDDGASDSVSISLGLTRTGGYTFDACKIQAIKENAFTGTPSTINSALAFITTNSETRAERMRIDSSGVVKIEQTSADRKLRLISTGANGSNMLFQDSTSGTGTSDGLYVGMDDQNRAYVWNFENNFLAFGTNNTERVRILDGGGLTFNGDSAQVNALDDYEEGTFTPTIHTGADDGSGGAPPISIQAGRYTKTGNIVFVDIYIRFATGAYSNGAQARIGGLPYAVSDDSYAGGAYTRGGGTSSYHDSTSDITTNYGSTNTGTFYLYYGGGSGFIFGGVDNADLTGKYWIGTFMYHGE